MKHLRCILRLHPWKIDSNPLTLQIIRGCPSCGKIQIVFRGFWHDWAKGWTWKKWLETKPQLEAVYEKELQALKTK